jgi:ubiquitin carboxyl-terminal hydrolase 4/11/15
MRIYKAPKILMFHLRRFKSSGRYFKSKLETLVKFDISGVDLSDFVLNSNLPSFQDV